MEPQSSLPYSQAPANCPYPEPTPSSPHNPFPIPWRSILILYSHLRLGLLNGLFPSGFPHQNILHTSLPSVGKILGEWIVELQVLRICLSV